MISRQQWTADLAQAVAAARPYSSDCSLESAPGQVKLIAIQPESPGPALATHHMGAADLLALAQELYGATPRTSLLLTVGGLMIETTIRVYLAWRAEPINLNE